MVKNLEKLIGPGIAVLALSACPQTDDDTTECPYITTAGTVFDCPADDDDSSPIANDDDSAIPADDDTSADDDSGDDYSSPLENDAPYAVISAPTDGATVYQNQSVAFDGCNSYDQDGDLLFYHWDFGDGTTQNDAVCNPEHTYSAAPGLKEVRLRVEDPEGAEHEVSLELLLEEEQPINQPPVAIAGGPYTIPANQPYFFDFGSSGTGSYDPDGTITNYYVEWGDFEGSYTSTSIGNDIIKQYPPGTYSLLLRVTDNESAVNKSSTTVNAQ